MKLTLASEFAALAALLLACSSFIRPGASFRLRQYSRTLVPCTSQCHRSREFDRAPKMFFQSGSNLGAKGLESFHQAQWDLYVKNHVGHWVGIQTGYDPEVVEVADYMYTEVDLDLNPSGTEIRHTNSMVVGEIRADCETCFDSERLKSREVGVYSQGNLRSRLCANVEVRGPGITPRGLSTELILRHGDGRIRVLIAHEPMDYMEVQGAGMIPAAYVLRDIVITRERLNKRPLKLDDNPDVMWVATDKSPFEVKLKGRRQRFDASGAQVSEEVTFDSLPVCEVVPAAVREATEASLHTSEPAENDGELDAFRRVFPGGIKVEAPWIVTNDIEVRSRVTWRPSAGIASQVVDQDNIYGAEIAMLNRIETKQLPDGRVVMAPPRLTDLFVDEFRVDAQ